MSDARDAEKAVDQRSLRAALTGDKEALTALVHRHYGRVFGYLVRLSGNYHVAEDLAQETFYRMWRGLPGLREATPFRTWLYRIARNAYVDYRRSWHGRHVVLRGGPELDRGVADGGGCGPAGVHAAGGAFPDASAASLDSDPVPSIVEKRLQRSRTLALLGRLSPRHRAVVVLRFYEEFTLGEIAETLELPLGTVKSRLHYAFRELRRAVEAGGRGGPARAGDLRGIETPKEGGGE